MGGSARLSPVMGNSQQRTFSAPSTLKGTSTTPALQATAHGTQVPSARFFPHAPPKLACAGLSARTTPFASSAGAAMCVCGVDDDEAPVSVFAGLSVDCEAASNWPRDCASAGDDDGGEREGVEYFRSLSFVGKDVYSVVAAERLPIMSARSAVASFCSSGVRVSHLRPQATRERGVRVHPTTRKPTAGMEMDDVARGRRQPTELLDFDKANEILFHLRIIYKQQGKYMESLEGFDCILRNPPSPLAHADIWFQVSHVYEQQKDHARANVAYERVVQETPSHAKSVTTSAPLPQDVHPTAYASAAGPPVTIAGEPPLLMFLRSDPASDLHAHRVIQYLGTGTARGQGSPGHGLSRQHSIGRRRWIRLHRRLWLTRVHKRKLRRRRLAVVMIHGLTRARTEQGRSDRLRIDREREYSCRLKPEKEQFEAQASPLKKAPTMCEVADVGMDDAQGELEPVQQQAQQWTEEDMRDGLLPLALLVARAQCCSRSRHRRERKQERCRAASATRSNANENANRECRPPLFAARPLSNARTASLQFCASPKGANDFTLGKSGSDFRIAVCAFMFANKFVDDNMYTNKTWSDVFTIPLDELNKTECEFLLGVGFRLFVDEPDSSADSFSLRSTSTCSQQHAQEYTGRRLRYFAQKSHHYKHPQQQQRVRTAPPHTPGIRDYEPVCADLPERRVQWGAPALLKHRAADAFSPTSATFAAKRPPKLTRYRLWAGGGEDRGGGCRGSNGRGVLPVLCGEEGAAEMVYSNGSCTQETAERAYSTPTSVQEFSSSSGSSTYSETVHVRRGRWPVDVHVPLSAADAHNRPAERERQWGVPAQMQQMQQLYLLPNHHQAVTATSFTSALSEPQPAVFVNAGPPGVTHLYGVDTGSAPYAYSPLCGSSMSSVLMTICMFPVVYSFL
ncbi:hypothetical protein DFH11DRAFT_1550216 [Phellopilus nigrolimitatus]|nr:hypothetical protein DFH11DRAFT_1833511 [Phellopilus nigrolimitatus]KAH8105705.1 hypothetical protein DFH11DRAFT_1550216 [Phellopilus nigrolimitatus]